MMNAAHLGAHDDLTVSPVQMLEPQSADFLGSQSEAREKQQNRVITQAVGGPMVTRGEQPFHLVRSERPRYMRISPASDLWQTDREVGLDPSTLQRISKEATQRHQCRSGTDRAELPSFTQDEPLQVSSLQMLKTQRPTSESAGEKAVHGTEIAGNRRW
jgi:hypothetical protein